MGICPVTRFHQALAAARAYDPDVYWFTGDFCARDPQAWVFESIKPQLESLGKPYLLAPGNHDARSMLRAAFPELPGSEEEPILQSLEIKGRQFLALDTRYGVMESEQVNWLEEKLKEFPYADLIMHHPPFKMGLPFMDNNYALRDTERLHEVLFHQDRPVRVFCGHYHCARFLQRRNVTVHLGAPTSFFIHPDAPEFVQDFLPPAYTQIEYHADDEVRVIPVYVDEKAQS